MFCLQFFIRYKSDC